MNTGELDSALFGAERRVLKIQGKLHWWARDDPHRRFDDLFNLVADPAFLLVAWDRVRGNRGARTAGVDGRTARSIESGHGVEGFLGELRSVGSVTTAAHDSDDQPPDLDEDTLEPDPDIDEDED